MKPRKRVRAQIQLNVFGGFIPVRFVKSAIAVVSLSVSVVASAQAGTVQRAQRQAGSLADVVQPYLDRREIAGAVVLIANRTRVIDQEAFGYADIGRGTPMKPNHMFWIASMTKAMTAATVMMLVDEGKLRLDDPVDKYLPEFRNQMVSLAPDPATASAQPQAKVDTSPAMPERPEHPITLRELLSHTSGLPFRSKREPDALDLLPLKTAVESYAAEPLQSQPGRKFLYSNEGINTAARIVEVVSGMPFEDFLRQRLFAPLGMKDTTFWPTEDQAARIAKSYVSGTATTSLREVPIDQLTYPLTDRTRRFPMPAGGLFSTAGDLARFCQMMLNQGIFHGRRLLSQESVRLITSKETGDAVPQSYGLGWNVGDGVFEHGGAYKTEMKVDRKRGVIVVFLVQRADDWRAEEVQQLMNALEQKAIDARGTEFAAQ